MFAERNRIEEIRTLQKQIEESEGKKIYNAIERLKITFYIFEANYKQLKQRLGICENKEFIVSVSPADDPQRINAYLDETSRLFHNFVAGAQTLIDHTRNHINDLYSETEFFNEYKTKLESDLSDIPVRRFVQDLRNYTLHCKQPLTIACFTLNSDSDKQLKMEITLDITMLQQWHNWHQRSLEFLIRYTQDIPIIELCGEYYNLINAFYSWLGRREAEINKSNFEETDKLISSYNEIMKPEENKER